MHEPPGFRWFPYDGTVSPSALLTPDGPLCGIYILEFDDGECYAGQSVNFLQRFAEHRRHQPGRITAFGFREVARSGLDEAERDTIQALEHKVHLRNVALVGMPLRSSTLDLAIEPAVQEAWLSGDDTRLVLGDRLHRPEPTTTARDAFEQLCAHPLYNTIVSAFAAYIMVSIPRPHLTEARFWTMTAMPSTNHWADGHRLAAISVNNVETLVVSEERTSPSGPWLPWWFINVSADVRLPRSRAWAVDLLDGYATIGPVARISSDEPLAPSAELCRAERRLAMGLLRKGQTMFRRFHNPLLADAVFEYLHAHHSAEVPVPRLVPGDRDEQSRPPTGHPAR